MCDSIGFKLKIPKTGINANSNRNSPTSSTPSSNNNNPSSTDDFVISLDNSDNIQCTTNESLLNRLNHNLELESTKRELELDEMRIQIAMLEDEKAFKLELNKQDLLQKSFEIRRVLKQYFNCGLKIV